MTAPPAPTEAPVATEAARPRLSALVVVHDEADHLGPCLACLAFADEILVVLDRCTDASPEIAEAHGARTLAGAWTLEGPRRNAGIAACTGDWILEVDADERVPPLLAAEIRETVDRSPFACHLVPVDNYVGDRLVRYGWGASFGRSSYPGLFRKGTKRWGDQRVHPALTLEGRRGPRLENRLDHFVDRSLSDMLQRLDRYTTLRAADLRESGDVGRLAPNLRRVLSRFWKCYVSRKGYRENGYGLMIALCAALYPLISHLKARQESE